MVLFRKNGCFWAQLLYSGKSCSNRAKVVVFGERLFYSGKVVVFGQNFVLFGLKLLYLGIEDVFGQSCINRAKVAFCLGKSACIRAKVVVFWQYGCFMAKVVVFGQTWLY